MGKRFFTYFLGGLVVLFFAVTVAGCVVKVKNAGRIAPGIILCGRDVSGMKLEEAERLPEGFLPEFTTELRCHFLPELQEEVEAAVKEEKLRFTVQGGELCLTVKAPMVRVLLAETIDAVTKKSSEVKVWEWLYAEVTGKAFQSRTVEAVLVWEEAYFGELLAIFEEMLERDCVEATVQWEMGHIVVKESRRGFRLETAAAWKNAEQLASEVLDLLRREPIEGMVVRFFLNGTVLMPRLTTSQAKKCDTKIGEFTTGYQGAGSGRAQNIAAGASHLHAKVILPGEEFSTAAALMPFTSGNGYATGGTYINGALSESIGGGVCQLSTTLYNALLRTTLEITERCPHSMPVRYISPGQDAAIAGDYKDLKFKNNTKAPVILLCETTEDKVRVTLYGTKEARRKNVTLESVITEKTESGMTVEVYRIEKAEDGAVFREKISTDRYRNIGG